MNDQPATQSIQISPHYYFKRAINFIRIGNLADAVSHIDCAIVFSKHSPFYVYQKIKILFEGGSFHECSNYIKGQAHFLYKNASLYILCKAIYYYQHINKFSIEALKEILSQSGVPYCLAEEYESILNLNPSDFFSYAKKACSQDNYELCIDYCHLLIRLNKTTWEVYYLMAYAYHMTGDLYKASEYYKACLKMNVDYDIAYNYLGLVLMELNLFEEALSYLDKARCLHPGQIDYLSHLAECYFCLGQYDSAIKILEEMIKICPSRIQTYFNLSHIYKRQNKKALSKKYMKIARKRLKK